MKLILSRKGFDSSFADMPSPILPDGTLLSIPIPSDDKISYDELNYNGKSYSELLKELKKSFNYTSCHLDPDIRKECKTRDDKWVAAFGQSDAALSHLFNNNVSIGDIFLFFGWFRKTEYDKEGKLRFVKNAPNLQIIFGYLQVGEILNKYDDIKRIYWHPHADIRRENDKLNAIYLASNKLFDLNLNGYGTFNFSKELVLTKEGYSKSRWELPKCLKGKKITYHKESNDKGDYFQSVARGQEFIVEMDNDILEWIKDIVKNSIF